MKARLETAIDTLWANQVMLSVEAELDNPHLQMTRELATLMLASMHEFVEELRSENERAAFSIAQMNARHRALDEREAKLTEREHAAGEGGAP